MVKQQLISRFDSDLCHINSEVAVVKVTGWVEDLPIGSALAQGSNVEEAEIKAILRLEERYSKSIDSIENVNISSRDPIKTNSSNQNPIIEVKSEDRETTISNSSESHIDLLEPEDWSEELAEIDNQ